MSREQAPGRRDARPQRRLRELDVLRGLAALGVLLFHLTTRFAELFPQARAVPVQVGLGDYYVLLFFAISGFSIFFSLGRVGSAADFAVNRFARLYPVYWLAMALTLAAVHGGGVDALKVPWSALPANIAMLNAYVYQPSVDSVYWTLAVELGFYASMVAVWRLLGRSLARVETALLPWLGLSWAAHLWPDALPYRLTLVLVLGYLPFFAIGMLFYRIWSGQRRWAEQAPLLALALAVPATTQPVGMAVAALVIAGLFAALVSGGLRFLCVRPVLWLGAVSYPLYLVHENVGFVVMLRLQALGIGPWGALAAAVLMAFGLAAGLHHFVEGRSDRWIKRLWAGLKARRGAADAVSAQ